MARLEQRAKRSGEFSVYERSTLADAAARVAYIDSVEDEKVERAKTVGGEARNSPNEHDPP